MHLGVINIKYRNMNCFCLRCLEEVTLSTFCREATVRQANSVSQSYELLTAWSSNCKKPFYGTAPDNKVFSISFHIFSIFYFYPTLPLMAKIPLREDSQK